MNTFLTRTLTASALALLILAGCQSARMPIPETFADQTPLLVKRSDTQTDPVLRIGAYEAHSYWRIEAETPRASGTARADRRGPAEAESYGFTLRLGNTDLWEASCTAEALTAGAAPTDRVTCTLTATNRTADAWTLSLKPMTGARLAGVLHQGTESYQVYGTNQTKGGIPAWNQTGFLVGQGEEVMAALDLTEQGRLWMLTSTDVRQTTLLTALSAALIITEDVRTA